MKIVLIHQAFRTPSEGGGTRHFELLKHLVADGKHQATVIGSTVSYLGGDDSPQGDDTIDGIFVRRVSMYKNIHASFFHRVVGFLSFMTSAFFAGAKESKNADVVMGTTPPLFQALSAWAVAAIRGKTFLLEVRDLWPDFAIDMGLLKNPLLIRIARTLECFLYKRADKILVNSPAFTTYLTEERQIDPSKIQLIPNGVDPAMFSPGPLNEEVRESWNVKDEFVLTYAGAMGPANDLRTLVAAAERLKDEKTIRFVILGDGKDRKNTVKLIEELGLENIKWLGVVGKDEIAKALAASDACIAILQDLPMFRTVYPNKVFDYMAAGRPTLLAIDGVIRDVVEKSRGGIFAKPGSVDAIANAVQALARDPKAARKMGENARRYVVTHFDRKQHAKDFQALIANLSQEPDELAARRAAEGAKS